MTATLHALNPVDKTPARAELAAMRAIADALDTLPDDAARARALGWAAEFFNLKDGGRALSHAAAHQTPLAGASPQSDPSLAVEDLSSFFEREDVDPDQMAVTPSEPKAGVRSMLQNFVADFQKLARDWQD